MKNIITYALVALALSASTERVVANSITIYNRSGKTLYLALVKTQNYKGDKKLYKGKGSETSSKLYSDNGKTSKALLPNSYIQVENFPMPPATLGVTKYNRSLWVSEFSKELTKALNKGEIDLSTDYAFRLGSAKGGMITAVKNNQGIVKSLKFDTSAKSLGADEGNSDFTSAGDWD